MEHRWGTRMEIDEAAELRTADGQSTYVLISDASLSGARLVTALQVQVLSCVSLRPVASTGDWLDACVVRADVENHVIAVEWLDPWLRPLAALLAARRVAAPAGAASAERTAARDYPARSAPQGTQPAET
jgi:hypothetical protein